VFDDLAHTLYDRIQVSCQAGELLASEELCSLLLVICASYTFLYKLVSTASQSKLLTDMKGTKVALSQSGFLKNLCLPICS
jgi:hypothetical protein